jgi:hypothetical protein
VPIPGRETADTRRRTHAAHHQGWEPGCLLVYGNATTLRWAASTRRSTSARGRRDPELTCRHRPAATGALVPVGFHGRRGRRGLRGRASPVP